ncbi:MAG: hypothetical protein K0S38_365 [Candidatus Paceibacter sp.]|jgi:hypothetical protein|nr:hypothetical protein [Candidatus Paceibacter sp.]
MKNPFENSSEYVQQVPVEEIPEGEIPELEYEKNEAKGLKAEINEIKNNPESDEDRKTHAKPELSEDSKILKKVFKSGAAVAGVAALGQMFMTGAAKDVKDAFDITPTELKKRHVEVPYTEAEIMDHITTSLKRIYPDSEARADGTWFIPDLKDFGPGQSYTLTAQNVKDFDYEVKTVKKEIDNELRNQQHPEMQEKIRAFAPYKIDAAIKEGLGKLVGKIR